MPESYGQKLDSDVPTEFVETMVHKNKGKAKSKPSEINDSLNKGIKKDKKPKKVDKKKVVVAAKFNSTPTSSSI